MLFMIRRGRLLRGLFYLGLTVLILLGVWAGYYNKRHATATAEPFYHGDPGIKAMALTCNVFWGEEYVAGILETLTEKDVKMTFFIGGTWAEKFPHLVEQIHDQGHEIGSHGYSHPHPDGITREANMRDITRAQEILSGITGERPVLYAPPYGERGEAVLQAAEELGYRTILWTIDTIDWQRPAPQVISQRVFNKAHNGGIVLMHPTAPTLQALPEVIDGLRQMGYRLVTVGELLELAGQ